MKFTNLLLDVDFGYLIMVTYANRILSKIQVEIDLKTSKKISSKRRILKICCPCRFWSGDYSYLHSRLVTVKNSLEKLKKNLANLLSDDS